jgi:hypothetical protein
MSYLNSFSINVTTNSNTRKSSIKGSSYNQQIDIVKSRFFKEEGFSPIPKGTALAKFLEDEHDVKSGMVQCLADSEEKAYQALDMLKNLSPLHGFTGDARVKLSSNGRQWLAQILMKPLEVESDEDIMARLLG